MICNNKYLADILRVCEIKKFNLGDAFSKSLSILNVFYSLPPARYMVFICECSTLYIDTETEMILCIKIKYKNVLNFKFINLVRSCGLLNVPRATKSNYDYVLGTTTSITGCREGSLSGETTYTCVETSNITQAWSPSVSATCKRKNHKFHLTLFRLKI